MNQNLQFHTFQLVWLQDLHHVHHYSRICFLRFAISFDTHTNHRLICLFASLEKLTWLIIQEPENDILFDLLQTIGNVYFLPFTLL